MQKYVSFIDALGFKFFFIGLIISVSLLWPLIIAPYFTHHDDVQIIRIHQMNKCFQDLQIPCRWVPDLGGLYGYPIFNYYAPLPYYIGEIFYLLSSSLIFSAKMIFMAPFLGAYIFMFLLGRKLWGNLGGFISGIFYSFAPYHAVDIYVRGAMGELWALMFFPAIFWSVLRLKEKINLGNSLLISLFIALLVLSHNISTLIFLPTVGVFVLILFILNRRIKFLYLFFVSIILGLLMASFYLLPVIYEKNLVHVETTTYGYFYYTEHFKGIKKTVLDRSWGWGASVREVPGGEKDGMSFQIGWVHILGLLVALFVVKQLWQGKKIQSLETKNEERIAFILFCAVMVMVGIFMIHPRSLSVWQLIESLKYLQFPWRFLMVVIFFISAVAGSMVLLVGRWKRIVILTMMFLVIALNFGYFQPEYLRFIKDEELLIGKNWEVSIKRSIFDYLPIYAEAPPAELATERYIVLSGNPLITDFQERSNVIKFNINTPDLTRIRLSQYYFPEWVIKVDGKEVDVTYQNELGLMTFAVDPGQHTVEARFHDTLIRRVANWITVFAVTIFVILFLFQIQKVRKIAHYFIKGLNG